MKKLLIIIASILMTYTVHAQRVVTPTVTKTKTLKTTDLGNQKLEVAIYVT